MPLEPGNSLDYWGLDNPKCPFCDKEIDISKHDLYRLYEEGQHEFDCPECEKEITVSTSVSFSFSTDKQPG